MSSSAMSWSPRPPRALTRGLLSALVVVGVAFLPTAPPAFAAAPFGNALRLDGIDDYASAPDSSSLDIGDSSGESFTLEAFVYVPDEASDANQVVFYQEGAYRLSVGFNTASDDVLVFGVRVGATWLTFTAPHALATGWHHVAATYDNQTSANDAITLFADGSLLYRDQSIGIEPGINNASSALSVGANSGAVPWNGWIDEARISGTVRYTGAYTVPSAAFTADAGTRALWHFDDAACTASFADASGNGNTLTGLNGAATGMPSPQAPTLRFETAAATVKESVGAVTVTVTRAGDPEPTVSVDYSTTSGTAAAGSDYTPASGTLAFGSCVTSRTLQVPVVDDSAREGDETILVALASPSGGATLGPPSSMTLTIARSDQRPDGWVSLRSSSGYIGNNVYNVTGTGQTKSADVDRGDRRSYFVRVYNDGTGTNTFTIRGTASPSGAVVRYFVGSTDVTAKMRSTNGFAVKLAPGAYKSVRVQITVRAGAVLGSRKTAAVSATWSGDSVRKDVVKAVARVTG